MILHDKDTCLAVCIISNNSIRWNNESVSSAKQ